MHKVIFNISHRQIFAWLLIISANTFYAQTAIYGLEKSSLSNPTIIPSNWTKSPNTSELPSLIKSSSSTETLSFVKSVGSAQSRHWNLEIGHLSMDTFQPSNEEISDLNYQGSVFQHTDLTTVSSTHRSFDFLNYVTPRDPMRIFRKRFFWGIAFAGTQAKMKMELDPVFWQRTDSIKSIRPGGQLGGGFGGSVAMRMGKFWEVKMLTMLQLHERTLQYTWQHNPGPNLKIETISLDIPLTLKYRSTMPDNTGMYIIGGLRWSHDFQSNEDVPIGDTKPLVAIKKEYILLRNGCGF